MRETDPPPTTTIITGSNGGIKRVRSRIHKKCGEVPPWVLVMINLEYQECNMHSNPKENNKLDRFCINCVGSFCSKCSSNHHGHNYIQIRRYIYCDVINRPDSYYCSIQCKVAAMYNTVNTNEATVDNDVVKSNGEGSENGLHNAKEDPALINSKRKRSRKGCPRRAPLF